MEDPKEPTEEQLEQIEADAQKMFDEAKRIVEAYKSSDMITDKVVTRIGLMGSLCGGTRTNVLGAVAYAATYGPIVGLSKDQVLGLFEELYDVVNGLPSTPDAKVRYAAMNAKYQEKMKDQAMAQDQGIPFVSPGNDKVH